MLAGAAAAIFLISLDIATRTRDAHPEIIWLLPLAGLAVGWMYFRFGRGANGGSNLILEEIHDPRNTLPVRMAPFVLIGTLLTHLFGGSAGREGTAVQMGATLSDQLTRFFKIEPEERKILLVAGAGAGFGAAIGAPWAGSIFGMEVVAIGGLRLFAGFECLIASFVGYETAAFVGAHHSVFPRFAIPGPDLKTAFFVAIAGAAFGLASLLFVKLTHLIERALKKYVAYPPFKPFVAGCLLVALYRLEGSYRFVGLGIPVIQSSILTPSSFSVPGLKAFFTALTVGSGFKGGEFVPLVFVGATLGSALSLVLPVAFPLLAGLGFASVFAGASNTPIACTLMACEIFGWPILPYALVACFASYYCSGHHGIYGGQKIRARKHERALKAWTRVSSWSRGARSSR
jgi:H+/Cl- antiporter ClcA